MPSAIMDQLLVDAETLFSLPDVYLRIRETLNDPDAGLADMAAIITLDPALSARFLRMANSAMFGLRNEVGSVSHAVNLLGAQLIHDVVLATSVAELFDGMEGGHMDVVQFWRESVQLAVTSKATALTLDLPGAETLFLHGLLADIGHMVIYQKLPGLAEQAFERAANSCRPVHLVEREMFGLDHAEVGGALADLWQLPREMADCIRYQYRPEADVVLAQDIAVVNVARFVAFSYRDGLTAMHPGIGRILDVTPEHLELIRDAGLAMFGDAMQVFSLRSRKAA